MYVHQDLHCLVKSDVSRFRKLMHIELTQGGLLPLKCIELGDTEWESVGSHTERGSNIDSDGI